MFKISQKLIYSKIIYLSFIEHKKHGEISKNVLEDRYPNKLKLFFFFSCYKLLLNLIQIL